MTSEAWKKHRTPRICARCGGTVPENGGMRVVNHNTGYRGYFCDKEECRDAGFEKAQEN